MSKYRQISIEEREKIYQFLKTDISLTKIASHLGRHKSTISREISRNQSEKLGYLPDRANNLSLERKNRKLSKMRLANGRGRSIYANNWKQRIYWGGKYYKKSFRI